MKHLKSFKEEIDLSQYDEVEPGKFVPKETRYEDVNPVYYKLTPEQIKDIVSNFFLNSGISSYRTITIDMVEKELQNYKNNKI